MTILDRARLGAETIVERVEYRTPEPSSPGCAVVYLGLEPAQLAWLVDSLEETKPTAERSWRSESRGMTTVFLNEALSNMSDPHFYI